MQADNKSYYILSNMKQTKSPKRGKQICSFRFCGPIRQMIQNEIRSGKNKTCAAQDAIAAALAAKYPKLADAYKMLREEGAH